MTSPLMQRIRRQQLAQGLRLACAWGLIVTGLAGFVVLLGWLSWRVLLLVTR